MRSYRFALYLVLLLALVLPATAFAQSDSGNRNTAREQTKATAERQARAEIESLLGRLCPGRCELVDLQVTVTEPQAVGEVYPGFEGAAGSRFEAEVERLEATILMDSNLPENFQANIPRMAQFRLQDLADNVEIRPEMLDFPQPQLPPMPDPMPRQPPPPPPMMPEPEPQAQPQPESEPLQAPEQAEADGEPQTAQPPLWQQLLPWIALLLTLLILGGLIIMILRRLEALTNAGPDTRQGDDGAADAKSPAATMPDAEALREELKRSRSACNRMLRRWIDDDSAEVAMLIRLVGPDILADLRRDPQMRPALQQVSQQVAHLDESIDAESAQAIARKARSRMDAELVIDDSSAESEWEFLEGLALGQITTLLAESSRRERGFVLTRLSPVLRSRYLENLDSTQRRDLLLSASRSESLSRTESRQLAARLRQRAQEFTDAGRQAAGQAEMLVEMVASMARPEQESLLGDLRQSEPDVARAVLSRICLEATLLVLPRQVLTNAIHRMPIDSLTTFLQGSDADLRDQVLGAAANAKRQALTTELSLDIPATRADFLEARNTVLHAVVTTLERDGHELAKFNLEALNRATNAPPTPAEVSS